ncbi:uncharacterized protein UTRI_05389_B [Ustilago trichophora]|uniref:Uncharacterized protein n=1 Tax=Ustilago trichophora TaxID=86804 RepID=A0A5C3ELJ0_9BASI|nr:uncharacterized protein UTRI_05389_B [Ustilago trichophora]
MAVIKPGFLGPSSSHGDQLNVTATGFYVVMSTLIASYASKAIGRLGIQGYPGAYRIGVIAFCFGSWLGIYRSGAPLYTKQNNKLAEQS